MGARAHTPPAVSAPQPGAFSSPFPEPSDPIPAIGDEVVCLPRRAGDPHVPAIVVVVHDAGGVVAIARDGHQMIRGRDSYWFRPVPQHRRLAPAPPHYPRADRRGHSSHEVSK